MPATWDQKMALHPFMRPSYSETDAEELTRLQAITAIRLGQRSALATPAADYVTALDALNTALAGGVLDTIRSTFDTFLRADDALRAVLPAAYPDL